MRLESGRAFFAYFAGTRRTVEELRRRYGDALDWQNQSVSAHSPGPIAPNEVVYRQLVQPLHIDFGASTLTPTALNDVATIGMSVDRAQHRSLEEIFQAGSQRVANRPSSDNPADRRTFFGLAKFNVASLRAIVDDEGRAGLAAFDTALCDNHAHGDVFQIVDGKKAGRSVRSKLLDAVEAIIRA